MNQRPHDFYSHQASIHIDASPDRVWEIMGDLGASAEWAGSGQVLSIEKTTDGTVDVGTEYLAHEKIGAKFQAISKITAYEPNRRISWLSAPTPLKGAPDERWHMWTITLEPEGSGTRMTQEVRAAKAPFPMRIVQVIAVTMSGGTKTMDKGMDRTLQIVKERAERGATVSIA